MTDLLKGILGGTQAQAPGQSQRLGLGAILDPEIGLPMAAALLGNQGNMQNVGNAFGAMAPAVAQKKERNKTYDWLKANAPEYAQLIDGGAPPSLALELYAKNRFAEPEKGTDDMREYEFAKSQGFDGSFLDYQLSNKRAGANSQSVTVGGGKYGTIPQGFELMEGPEGATMRRIPGGPEDTSVKEAKQQGQADVASRVVTSAAQRAREAAGNRNFGHVGQGTVAKLAPWSDSAEVSRQVEVMKAAAKIENLTAMRQASPTGGALGAVSDQESQMLAAKSGALDPSSPNFARDLDDYELTLLQVVHGPQEGQRIFMETRRQQAPAVQAPAGGARRTSGGVSYEVLP
jgi:hypothetical protein